MPPVQKSLEVRERRRFQRARLNLSGRYILADRQEYPCQVQNMSPGSAALVAPVSGTVGERVVAYIEHVGRLEGTITRVYRTGFAMTIGASSRKREKLATQLTWLANRHILDLPQHRGHERIMPRRPHTKMVLPNGTSVTCEIAELSQSGAAVLSATKPPLNALIRLGKSEGHVVRVSDDGFAVEFTSLQDIDSLEENVKGA
jgi:hypothetical protein